MKLATPKCPSCHKPAGEIHETVTVYATITVAEDGEMDYAGKSKVDWNGQYPTIELDDTKHELVTLYCESGHEWLSRYTN